MMIQIRFRIHLKCIKRKIVLAVSQNIITAPTVSVTTISVPRDGVWPSSDCNVYRLEKLKNRIKMDIKHK